MTTETRICQNCKSEFRIEPDDFDFYKNIGVTPPTWCPLCRDIRRNLWRNERALYKRPCAKCGKEVIGRFSPDKPHAMYCQSCWWSDAWNARDYGREYDFSKPFFEQFKDLVLATPHVALVSSSTVNSDWVNQETDVKNCYLEVGGHFNEDSAYSTYLIHGKDSFDNFWVIHAELSYESVNCERVYRTFFSEDCYDCRDVVFSHDCRNCSNVIGCAGLRNKQYHIFNKPVTKEAYEAYLVEHPLSSRRHLEDMRRQAEEARKNIPRRSNIFVQATNVSGDRIFESRNLENSWLVEKSEDAKHIYIGLGIKDSQDVSIYGWSELVYEVASGGGTYRSTAITHCFGGGGDVQKFNTSFLEYCVAVPSSNYCFGCVNLQKGEYCILNKQYSKETYEDLVPKIREQMNTMPYRDAKGRAYMYGDFFPPELSPFGYNETSAIDFYPLTVDEAKAHGYNWSEAKNKITYQFSDYTIPDDIRDVKDDITQQTLKCEIGGKGYRIIPMELEFYRRVGLPIPLRSPLQRHKDRIARFLPRHLFDRTCECGGRNSARGGYTNTGAHVHADKPCPNTFQTPYAPNRPEIVYCEQCYQGEVS